MRNTAAHLAYPEPAITRTRRKRDFDVTIRTPAARSMREADILDSRIREAVEGCIEDKVLDVQIVHLKDVETFEVEVWSPVDPDLLSGPMGARMEQEMAGVRHEVLRALEQSIR